MTQIYDEQNKLIPVTVVQAGPCPVAQVKTQEKDGYHALQLAFEATSEKAISEPQLGHFKQAGLKPHRMLHEIRLREPSEHQVGEVLTISVFPEGQFVDIIGTTKGRGFQGVVKRFNFSGGNATHGSMFHRRGGAYGQCQWPGEIDKGTKMPGHMGHAQRTVQNLLVVRLLEDRNLMLIKGSIPGANGGELLVRSAKKQKEKAA